MAKRKGAIFISGGASTGCAAVRESSSNGKLPDYEPALFVASSEEVSGIENAKNAGISKNDILVLDRKVLKEKYGKDGWKKAFCDIAAQNFAKRGISMFNLLGWIPIIPNELLVEYRENSNQHPGGLDPKFPHFGGKDFHGHYVQEVLLEFNRLTAWSLPYAECCAHRVIPEVDGGALLGYCRIPIFENDTAKSIADRLLPFEHTLQIQVIGAMSRGEAVPIIRRQRLIDPRYESDLSLAKKNVDERIEKEKKKVV